MGTILPNKEQCCGDETTLPGEIARHGVAGSTSVCGPGEGLIGKVRKSVCAGTQEQGLAFRARGLWDLPAELKLPLVATAASWAPDCRGLMTKPHAPFDGAEPTSLNLKRRPWRGVQAPQTFPARTRALLARGLARSAPGEGRGSGPAAGAPLTVLPPGTLGPRGRPRKMKLALLLPWACCCLCGSALATGFLYPFPAAALQQHGYPEPGAGSPGSGYGGRR